MGTAFWVRRFIAVLLLVGAIVALGQWMRGHTLQYAGIQGLIWGPITSAVFTTARIFQSRRKQHCAICKDTPEMARSGRADT
jgi:hypothetical protein